MSRNKHITLLLLGCIQIAIACIAISIWIAIAINVQVATATVKRDIILIISRSKRVYCIALSILSLIIAVVRIVAVSGDGKQVVFRLLIVVRNNWRIIPICIIHKWRFIRFLLRGLLRIWFHICGKRIGLILRWWWGRCGKINTTLPLYLLSHPTLSANIRHLSTQLLICHNSSRSLRYMSIELERRYACRGRRVR